MKMIHRIYVWVIILMILLMIGLFFIYHSRQRESSPDRPVSTYAPQDKDNNYWTEERMKSATPLPIPPAWP